MNTAPAPLPSLDSPEPSSFARQAANACLAAPLLIFGLSFCVANLLHVHRDPSARWLLLTLGVVELGFCVAGALLGVLAIVLARPGQRASVVPRALCGLVLLALLAAIAVPNFVRARSLALQRRQALQEVQTAAADLRAKSVKALTNGQGTTVDVKELNQSLGRAAEKTSGETAALLKATQRYVERVQAYQQAYAKAQNELLASKVLTVANLNQRSQIQERKALVQKFLDANNLCKLFLLQGDATFRQELTELGVPAAQAEAAMREFSRNSAVQLPLMINVRDADERLGRAMLGVLNLLDNQWGQWNYDPAARLVRFETQAALDQYSGLLAQIKQADMDGAAAQKRLASFINQPASSL